MIPPPSETSRIKLMTVFFGANDAVLPGQPQHVPLDEYIENLKKLLTHPALKPHGTTFILITPPPICEYITQEEDAKKGKHYIQRLASRTKEYADAAVKVGQELGVPIVNLWQAFMKYAGGWKEGEPLPGSKDCAPNKELQSLLRDGLHFNPKGYEIMYDEVLQTIRQYYSELDPETLPFMYPHWEVAPKASS